MNISSSVTEGIAEVVMNKPPVNALGVRDWFDLAAELTRLGADASVRVLVLRAEGRASMPAWTSRDPVASGARRADRRKSRLLRGVCRGVRVRGAGDSGRARALLGRRHRPRRQRGHHHCERRRELRPTEVDRGALGAATHLSRLVPAHKMRAMVYTSARASAAELHQFGSVLEVVPAAQLRAAALRVAKSIAEKSPM